MGCRERGTYRDSSRESSLSRTGTDDLDNWESKISEISALYGRATAKIRTFILERILEGRARLISIEGFYRDMIDIEGRVGVPK